jgi:uncharacterized membrane protein
MKRNYFLIGGLMVAAVLVATSIVYPHLPEQVPSHWNWRGQVDDYSAKWTMFVTMPSIMVGLMLLFAGLQWLSPRHFEVDTFRSTYLYIMLVLVGLMAYIQALMLSAGLAKPVGVNKALVGGICLMLALLGNVLGKVQRNFCIGIRTPWTIANERVWNATHRFGAKTFVVGGLLGFVLTLAGITFWIAFAIIMAAALMPVVYSLVYYKRLERRGEVQ